MTASYKVRQNYTIEWTTIFWRLVLASKTIRVEQFVSNETGA